MVEVRNFFSGRTPTRKVATSSVKHTVFPPFGSSILTPKIQDDMHYHDNDGHIFTVLEGQGCVSPPY
jgi:hypothetical protein